MIPDEESPASGADFPSRSAWREVSDPRVRAAFERVDRSRFVPEAMRSFAQRDEPLPIGEGQTVSQPFVVAVMLQALQLLPGDRVLEIGAGSGYQTALLSEVVRVKGQLAGGTVYSIERYASLLERARLALDAGGFAPHLALGDGALGWAEHSPYHGIVVSAAASAVPRALVEQLADAGRLVIPVDSGHDEQELWVIQRLTDRLLWAPLGPVRFVPLISPVLHDPRLRILPPPHPGRGQQVARAW